MNVKEIAKLIRELPATETAQVMYFEDRGLWFYGKEGMVGVNTLSVPAAALDVLLELAQQLDEDESVHSQPSDQAAQDETVAPVSPPEIDFSEQFQVKPFSLSV